MLRFDKAIYVSFLLKFILSARLSNSLCGSDVLLFSEFKMFFTNIHFFIIPLLNS